MIEKLRKFRKIIENETIFCFTSDVDWASEYAIEKTIEFFEKKQNTSHNVFDTQKRCCSKRH